MKVLSKRIFAALTCIILALSVVLLTSCGATDATQEEVANATETAANNYFETRTNFAKFANSTYTFKKNSDTKTKVTLNYKQNAADEQTIEGVFEDLSKNERSAIIYTKQIGDDIAVVFKVNNSEYSKVHSKELDETLKVTEGTDVADLTYTFAPITVDSVTTYYLVCEGTQKDAGDAEATTVKTKYTYATRDAYVEAINDVFQEVNDTVVQYFFEISTPDLMLTGGKAVKEGNKMTFSYDMTSTSVEDHTQNYAIAKIQMVANVVYNNNVIDSANTTYKTNSKNLNSVANSSLQFANGSNVEVITTVGTDFVENTYLPMEIDYILGLLSNPMI